MMKNPTISRYSIVTNNDNCHIETLNNKTDEDFTEPDHNIIQWDKEQMVPLLDGNGFAFIASKII